MGLSALILAKGDSKRLKGKNLRMFHGKPMFLWNVEKCVKLFENTYVSSDDNKILNLAKKAGAIPLRRPKDLCGDTPNIPVYQHCWEQMDEPDGIIAVQANSPTLDARLIILAMRLLEFGNQEIMTCHLDYSIYGSIWALTYNRLFSYETEHEFYNPCPDVVLLDPSVDVHNLSDLKNARRQFNNNKP